MSFMSVVLLLVAANANPPQIADRYAPGQLIVRLADDCRGQMKPAVNGELSTLGIPALDRLDAEWGVTKIAKTIRDPHPNASAQKYGLDLLYLLTAGPATDVPAMMAAYGQCPEVVSACPNIMRPVCDVPNDPRYSNQWHLAKIQAPGAWDVSHGDTNVRIAVVDEGIDYTHPDIAANVWINGLEDINGNHRFDPYAPPQGDLDGNDNDGNGYIDDVCGYDFQDNDPDPMPLSADDHGTHCWGITDAVTNNDTGIASIGWGCRGLCLRAGYNDQMYLNACIAALYYSVSTNCWVSSHSYGSTQSNTQERDAMQYAVDAGAIVCCAAGNDNNQTLHYPGGYTMVVGVAASDGSDHRASFSCYGTWVDVSSPGVGILSTVNDSAYTTMDGTSMATPMVAGLCALMKSANPSLTNADCLTQLYNACDSMPDPDYRAGLMGAGRINAMKALALGQRCYLTLAGSHVNDPNHNGIPEPGDVCGLTITLANQTGWQTATGVSALLTTADSTVTITKNTATFPSIAGGASADCSADSFVFTVSPSAVPHVVAFEITKTATPPSLAGPDYLHLRVGLPHILLVNDYAGAAIDRWYKEACDSLRVLYDMYSTQTSGAPGSDTLEHYPIVIWYTGLDSTDCVNAACRTALQAYLDNGGKLFISGQNIGQAIGTDPFYTNYLKAQFVTANTTKLFTLGLPGDPIGDGDTIVCGGAGGANNCLSPDGIRPTGGAVPVTIYIGYSDTTVCGGIRYRDGYRLVYFAEPFEAIDHAISRYVQKWTILHRILTFFDEPLPPVAVAEPDTRNPHSAVRTPQFALRIAPNPVAEQARIAFSLDHATTANVRIYDVRGRLVTELVSTSMAAGNHNLNWNLRDISGRRVAEGIYYCTLSTSSESRTAKLLISR
jgi:subtilisin family serine protease